LPPDSEEIELINRIVEHHRRCVDEYLKQLYSRLPTDQYDIQTYCVLSENPIDTLHELVEQTSADLVILSAHGCSGGAKRPYGSVSLSFIAYGTTPLLILQDLPSDRIVRNQAEMAVRERPGH
jgi:nucleotide-binding universal stress UspA family protein